MRKKKQMDTPTTPSSTTSIKKTIVKSSRVVKGSAIKRPTRKLADRDVDSELTQGVASVIPVVEGTGSLSASNRDSGTERSPTPLENDLLQYLTLHISPPTSVSIGNAFPQPDNPWLLTSFDIGVTEYLQGIVRLIKSDCPEAVHDIRPFLSAMEQAFVEVKTLDTVSK